MAETATAETPPSSPSQPPTNPPPNPEPQTPAKDPPAANQLAESERKRKAAERQAADAQKRIEELEAKDQTELERAQKKAADEEKRANEAAAKADRLERSAWIRTAARGAGFHDPEDAVAHLGEKVGDLDTEAKVKTAVEALAADESKSHLVGRRPEPQQMGTLPGEGTAPSGEPPTAPPAGEEMSPEQAHGELAKGLSRHILSRRRAGAGLGPTTGQE